MQGTQKAKTILKKRNKVEGFTPPISKLSTKSTVSKTVWYWHKDGHIDQWNRTQESRNKP